MSDNQWQPIETAPKNGVRIWAWFPHSSQAYAISFRENAYEHEPNWTLDDGESAWLTHDKPTHWMHLPTSPELGQKNPDALHEAALIERGYGLDAIGARPEVDLIRAFSETDHDYRNRLIVRLLELEAQRMAG